MYATSSVPARPSRQAVHEQNLPGWPVQRRYFDKDVLRTGDWHLGRRSLHVTKATLHRLVANFQLASRRGIRVPVVWNHSWDARDKIGEVVELRVSGDVLWARFWAADPADIRRLTLTASEVSVEIRQPWRDGFGNRYDIMMTHVAVVQLPVIPNQLPFRFSHKHQGVFAMTQPQTAPAAGSDVTNFVRVINQLLAHLPGTEPIPATQSLEELAQRLQATVDALPDIRNDDQGTVVQLQARVAELSEQLAAERQRAFEQQQQQFHQAVDRLVADARITPADAQLLMEAGQPAGYQLSLLSAFERLPAGAAFPQQPLTRAFANPLPPKIHSSGSMTAERAKTIASSFRG